MYWGRKLRAVLRGRAEGNGSLSFVLAISFGICEENDDLLRRLM